MLGLARVDVKRKKGGEAILGAEIHVTVFCARWMGVHEYASVSFNKGMNSR